MIAVDVDVLLKLNCFIYDSVNIIVCYKFVNVF